MVYAVAGQWPVATGHAYQHNDGFDITGQQGHIGQSDQSGLSGQGGQSGQASQTEDYACSGLIIKA